MTAAPCNEAILTARFIIGERPALTVASLQNPAVADRRYIPKKKPASLSDGGLS